MEMKKINGRNIYIGKTEVDLNNFLLNQLISLSCEAIKKSSKFVIALSGGNTPVFFYRYLTKEKHSIAWDKTHIFFADERILPYDDKESNYGLMKKIFFDNIPILDENIHPVKTDGGSQSAASKYEKEILNYFNLKRGQLPQFDLIMLGIGRDGHTASLFPNYVSTTDNTYLTCAVQASYIKYERVSITIPVINNARNVYFLVRGREKAEILRDILKNGNSNLPASKVKPKERKLIFILDSAAASLL